MEIVEAHTGHKSGKNYLVLDEVYLQKDDQTKIWTVIDGAANIKKTAKDLNIPYIYRFAHLLHNSLVKSNWIKIESMSQLLKKCQSSPKTLTN